MGSEAAAEAASGTGQNEENENEQLLIYEGFVERHAFKELLSSEILNGTRVIDTSSFGEESGVLVCTPYSTL